MTAGPSDPHVGLVVEGPGDAKALPILLRKHLEKSQDFGDRIGKPMSCNGRDNALVPGGVERYVATAAGRPGCRGVLVVLDSEGDASCSLGPELLDRAQGAAGVPVRIALAEVSFEDWIYASIETLNLTNKKFDLGVLGQAAIKSALRPAKYVKPTWQPRLTARIDLDLAASRSRSLSRMLDRFDELVRLTQ